MTSSSEKQNIIGRLRNVLVNTINMQTYIPKWIVIVIEDDIINSSTYDKSRASSFFGNVLEHLMKEHNTIMDEFKAMIPQKAKKHGWPFFLWVKPTSHKFYDNKDLRDKFNKCLTTVETLHDNVLALNLEQIWDQNDRVMFQTATQKLSATGYNTYWKALDRTIRYADLNVIRYGNKKMKDIFLEKEEGSRKKIGIAGKPPAKTWEWKLFLSAEKQRQISLELASKTPRSRKHLQQPTGTQTY